MAYMMVMGECFGCRRLFWFNAERVPSLRVNVQNVPDPNGTRQPVCETCVTRANENRLQTGLPPIEILPGAYEAEEVGI